MPLPEPVFSRWYRWDIVDGPTPTEAAMLGQVGCYLLGRFEGDPPDGLADPADSNVFYIGETHGSSCTLRGRLEQFANSAGFYGSQCNGHYAAWGYPKLFPQDRKGKGARSDKVYIALCP